MDRPSCIDNTFFIGEDIFIERITHKENIKPHNHDFVEFVYMLSGKSLHTVNGVEYSLESGDLLVVNYDEVHYFTAAPNVQFFNILIKPTAIDKTLVSCRDLFCLLNTNSFLDFRGLVNNECRFIRFSPEEKNAFKTLLLLLEKETAAKESDYALTTRTGVDFLLTMIFRKMQKSLISAPSDFKQLLDYIRENYAEALSAKDLAKLCHYNSSYFSRVFKKHTGTTFSEYIKRLRITESCRLINSDVKLGDLYLEVGYTNKTNFYKHFHQLTGMSPLEYKKVKK